MPHYEITAKVNSNIQIPAVITISSGGKEFQFIPDDRMILSEIKVGMEFPGDEISFVINPKGGNYPHGHLEIFDNENASKEAVEALQSIESLLSFETKGSLESIEWGHLANERYYSLSQSDEHPLVGFSFSYNGKKSENPFTIDEMFLEELTSRIPDVEENNVVLAYWRLGCNFLKKELYQLAYIQYYLIIENLYSNGGYKKIDVVSAYKASDEFMTYANHAFSDIVDAPFLCDGLELIFERYGLALSLENLPDLLLRVRNDIQHYHKGGTNSRNNPFLKNEYKAIAELLRKLTTSCLQQRVPKLNSLHNSND